MSPTRKRRDYYECTECGQEYDLEDDAKQCEREHPRRRIEEEYDAAVDYLRDEVKWRAPSNALAEATKALKQIAENLKAAANKP